MDASYLLIGWNRGGIVATERVPVLWKALQIAETWRAAGLVVQIVEPQECK